MSSSNKKILAFSFIPIIVIFLVFGLYLSYALPYSPTTYRSCDTRPWVLSLASQVEQNPKFISAALISSNWLLVYAGNETEEITTPNYTATMHDTALNYYSYSNASAVGCRNGSVVYVLFVKVPILSDGSYNFTGLTAYSERFYPNMTSVWPVTTVTVNSTTSSIYSQQSNTYSLSAFLQTARSLYSHPPNSPTCSSSDLVNISSDNFLSLKELNDSFLSMNGTEYHYVILNQSADVAYLGNCAISYGTNQNSTMNYVGGYPVQFNVTSNNGTKVGAFTYYVILPQISSYPIFVTMYNIGKVSILLMNYDQNCTTSYQSMWIGLVAG